MKLILLGPPGSGKGTVAQMLAKDFNFAHVSAGELLREEIKKGTTLGNDIKKLVETGALVPDLLVTEIMKLDVSSKENYIMDGFPRTLTQAEAIEDLDIDMAIYLEVPDEVVIDRFAGRRTDPVTGDVYHIKHNPAPAEIQDRLVQRKDDTPETVKDRLVIYHKQTQPLVDFYEKKGILKTIDGAPPPKKVYEVVKKVVEEFSK
ncbi:adenylate kinase [Candidatus Woesearchaeota archaeon]|jgi:adenylate kinase|nr:adenylate kinase [Candidatus Woesearchaeota archaeon]MBT4151306.1 adenylate kinase [Candidatus Woesearchaeota archaeon]MBT4247457.1 adenylate kinase [Candidatus Woesearchaeota archaeon]MBT4434128.1 adenylate kinase [Candidatus Woesearchaeota archaeon]MBT7331986.1 adenylate kinase [Candidatus Woesearchaeota archaeon]